MVPSEDNCRQKNKFYKLETKNPVSLLTGFFVSKTGIRTFPLPFREPCQVHLRRILRP